MGIIKAAYCAFMAPDWLGLRDFVLLDGLRLVLTDPSGVFGCELFNASRFGWMILLVELFS